MCCRGIIEKKHLLLDTKYVHDVPNLSENFKLAHECAFSESFKLAQKIVASLSESFNFSFDEGWANVCNTNIEALKRKFKKDSKKNNPYSSIKNPRSSFSFYTKENRAIIQKKNPKATFGQLSKLVSAEWNNLTEKEKKVYKKKEINDKLRYKKEREALAKQLESEAASQPAVEENLVSLISKIGEKITIRRSKYFENDGKNFFYVHNSSEKNIGKVI